MADKPDLNKLKNKFDFGSILDNLKSMINPASGTPDVDPEDALGVKIAQASVLLKEMVQHEHEHLKNMNELNGLLSGIYADLEVIRQEAKTGRAKTVDDTQPTVEEKAAAAAAVAPTEKPVEPSVKSPEVQKGEVESPDEKKEG